MKVTVEYEWSQVGQIQDGNGRLGFPKVADAPGAYRFDLPDRVYIGETDRLRRRMQHYRTPGSSQATNLRLNALLTDLVNRGVYPSVWIVTTAIVEVHEERSPLDLTLRSSRLLIESAALTAERLAGRTVENL